MLVGEDGQGGESSSAAGWEAELYWSWISLLCSKQLLAPHLVLELPEKARVWGSASLVLG